MVDSTNPRIMADNIRALLANSGGSIVVPNPEGEASGSLTSLGINGSKYSIPVYSPHDYSITEYATGQKWTDGRDVFGIVLHLESALALTGAWQSTGIPWSGKTIVVNKTACPIAFGTYEGTMLVKGFGDTSVQDIVIEYVKEAAAASTRKKK